ncbi:hypothetical protein AYJ57_25305 (plasmid) [Salipiger sp. CCB-MM3]|nr:hypothetical protein AYJ57_25305 [Salipiger sp. CCB-MM3]
MTRSNLVLALIDLKVVVGTIPSARQVGTMLSMEMRARIGFSGATGTIAFLAALMKTGFSEKLVGIISREQQAAITLTGGMVLTAFWVGAALIAYLVALERISSLAVLARISFTSAEETEVTRSETSR